MSSLSGVKRLVLVWHARKNHLSIPPLNRLNSSGPTSDRMRTFSLLVYRLAKLPTVLPARVQALIDFKPSRFIVNSTAKGLHGGDALAMTHSNSVSILRFVNTWLMLRGKHVDPGVLINSRSKTRSSVD